MQHANVRECLQSEQMFHIECDRECNVRLMDDSNFESYAAGHTFRYFGGLCREGFPTTLKPPSSGCWNVVVTPVKAGETVTHNVRVVAATTF